jgi:hypothetical protein
MALFDQAPDMVPTVPRGLHSRRRYYSPIRSYHPSHIQDNMRPLSLMAHTTPFSDHQEGVRTEAA